MSTDEPDAEDLAEAFPHVAQLEQQLKEADIDVSDIPERKGTTRRDLLAGSAGLLGLGGLVTAGSGTAQAGDDQVGRLGTDNNRLDAEIEDLDLTDQSSTPAEPGAGQVRFYSKNGTLYYLPNGGSETEVGSGSGGGTSSQILYATDFSGATGGEQINAALDAAATDGGRSVVLVGPDGPDTNGRWDIGADDVRIASSDTTLILNNCRLRLQDDTNRPVIELGDRNANYENIHVIGWGEARVDGNAGNQTLSTDGPDRLGVLIYNIDGFSIQNLQVGPTNGWGISPQNATDGLIRDIRFSQDDSTANQDGITTVGPLENITVRNISGTTYDDFIGLNNHSDQGMAVGNGGDIRNLRFDTLEPNTQGAGQPIRVLNGDGLTMEDVLFTDVSIVDGANADQGFINFGEQSYLSTQPSVGDIDDIRFENVTIPATDGNHTIRIALNTGSLRFEDITVNGSSDDVFNQDGSVTTDEITIRDVDADVNVDSRAVYGLKGTVNNLSIDETDYDNNNNNGAVYAFGGTVNAGRVEGLRAENTDVIWSSGGTVSVTFADSGWTLSGEPYSTLPSGVKFSGDLPPADVRQFGNVEGSQAYHDGSGGNTEGPAFNDGTGWSSLVDGSSIS